MEAACHTDNYLAQHYEDIEHLLSLIKEKLDNTQLFNNIEFEDRICAIIDKSSITSIAEPKVASIGDYNAGRLIWNMHCNVGKYIETNRRDIKGTRWKRNTGNGGFWFYLPNGYHYEFIIRPRAKEDHIACEFILYSVVPCPEKYKGISWEEIMKDPKFAQMMDIMDKCVSPLLQNNNNFEGRSFDWNNNTYFKSFSEKQKAWWDNKWDPNNVSNWTSYWINLENESRFKDSAIVKIIGDLAIALYDYHTVAQEFVKA